jgi:phenylacetate-CoA ligase
MIWDREAETATAEDRLAQAAASWQVQYRELAQRSPFYARKLREAGTGSAPIGLSDLHRLPFTTKQELKLAIDAAPPFGENLGVPPERVKRVYQTSGTTGSPSVIALSEADIESWTVIGSRSYYTTGIHTDSGVLSTYGAGPFVAGHTYLAFGRIGCRVVPVGPGDTERCLFALRAGIADILVGTPSFAQYLANRLEKAEPEAAGWPLATVVTGGEPGGGIPEIRDHIERVLGATVHEAMGIGDVAPSLFGECVHQQGMHFSGAGYIWPELVDPDTQELMEIETGAVGELVYTHLVRQAMPVLRFLGGDLVRIEGTSCECGRTGFRMRCLGRRDDMFIVRGVNVYPTAILAVVGGFRPRVTGRARVIREGKDVSIEPPVPVEVEVPDSGVDPGLAAEIETAIRSTLTFRAGVRLVPESAFGEAGYKTRLTVSQG